MTSRVLTLADLGEEGLLDIIAPIMGAGGPGVLVPNGDDAAVLAESGPVVVTTDSMTLGVDWLDEWSTPRDVGAKAVAQNLADVAAMGGTGTGLTVALMASGDLRVGWAEEFSAGLAAAAAAWDVPVLGGDLGSMPPGQVVVSVTALGRLDGVVPVLRSGAQPGDTLAVGGSLGRSGAGLELLIQGRPQDAPDLVAYHCAPLPPLHLGPEAARAGATAMLDLSDGLVRDSGRIARASGVRIELDDEALAPFVAELAVLDDDEAWSCVLTGGEEHSMLATFSGPLPDGFVPVGRCVAGAGVWLGDEELTGGGWDHYRI